MEFQWKSSEIIRNHPKCKQLKKADESPTAAVVMTRILISGGGLTGASVYHYLTTMLPKISNPLMHFTVWEKGPSPGGRMANSYLMSCHLDGGMDAPVQQEPLFCELGAQYLTKNEKTNEFDDMYKKLLDDGIIAPLEARRVEGMKEEHYGKTHYRSTRGLSRISSHLLNGANVLTNTYLCHLDKSSDGVSWVASRASSINNTTTQETFDIVILTMPFPNILEITGDVSEVIEHRGLADSMRKVKYSSRYALAAYYGPSASSAVESIPWRAKYIYDDDVIRYVAIESRKAAVESINSPLALLAHTSVPFGIENKDSNQVDVEARILGNLERIVGLSEAPIQTELLYWQTSQVSLAITGFGAAALAGTTTAAAGGLLPLLAIAGDSFTESNFEGCLRSAKAAAEMVVRAVNVKSD